MLSRRILPLPPRCPPSRPTRQNFSLADPSDGHAENFLNVPARRVFPTLPQPLFLGQRLASEYTVDSSPHGRVSMTKDLEHPDTSRKTQQGADKRTAEYNSAYDCGRAPKLLCRRQSVDAEEQSIGSVVPSLPSLSASGLNVSPQQGAKERNATTNNNIDEGFSEEEEHEDIGSEPEMDESESCVGWKDYVISEEYPTYQFPVDGDERRNEDRLLRLITKMNGGRLLWGKYSERIYRVLDVGAGSGTWAAEFAQEHPKTFVTGIDITEPDLVHAPENVDFIQCDMESEVVDHRNCYNIIRFGNMGWAIRNALRLFEKSFQQLRPGGRIEITQLDWRPRDGDGQLLSPERHPFARLCEDVEDGMTKLGLNHNATVGKNLSDVLRRSGFDVTSELYFDIPVGDPPLTRRVKSENHGAGICGANCEALLFGH